MFVRPETPIPRTNILAIVPQLADQAVKTVRLHPRRGEVAELGASKLGGMILWPKSEPWPCCDEIGPASWDMNSDMPRDAPHPPPIPVLQLRRDDVPELPFPEKTDLFQLLWCPTEHSATYVAKPLVYWRNARDVVDPRTAPPPTDPDGDYFPTPCRLHPERITEYPNIQEVDAATSTKLDAWRMPPEMAEFFGAPSTMYEWALSVCPSTKIGGYVAWIQSVETPDCDCGRTMRHLLTLSDNEYDGGTFPRWMPHAERHLWGSEDFRARWAVQNAPGWRLGGGRMYLFTCTECGARPIRMVYQR